MSTDMCVGTFLYVVAAGADDRRYDQDLCAPVDDEYWETGNPETCFVQPEGKPSKVEYFNEYIKLMEIYLTAMRSIVSIQFAFKEDDANAQ